MPEKPCESKVAERSEIGGRTMTEEVVLEGAGTGDEMEAHLITELRRRDWLTPETVNNVRFDATPPQDERGTYRLRIASPS